MSDSTGFFGRQLSHRTGILGLRVWEIVALGVGAFIVLILFLLSLRLNALARRSKFKKQLPICTVNMIPAVSKDIKEVVHETRAQTVLEELPLHRLPPVVVEDHVISAVDILDDEKEVVTFAYGGDNQVTTNFHSIKSKTQYNVAVNSVGMGQEWSLFQRAQKNAHSPFAATAKERAEGIPGGGSTVMTEQLGWGNWYSVDQLKQATSQFTETNIVGKGGYGIVYRGLLPDASVVAVKHLLNSREQAEKEFRVEVETIGCVRHKNLVSLLGYCAEGPHRMLVYEYVDNGNLEQWLHGPLGADEPIPWNARMKIIIGTAKGLAYLHEDLESKVVHRDVKASNILLDSSWNAKVSDFGLAKLLCAGVSHVTTRVMGTFGYVAPEYASTGLLTESSDVYSFGVLMMEVISGRDPVDYSRSTREVNLVEWMKRMVGSKRWEEVVDTRLVQKPSGRALKKALLVALRCVDPDALHRPRMGHVVYMLEADDLGFHHACRNSRGQEDGSNRSSNPVKGTGV
ncbi:hypothetical protein GOP47_0001707 [Adiantum capillus-veneris]|uniref:non-specific serine/threonine protein kinase n=1 Tax=Adiantum capillus-veneris TaxID=13818 RepID=A0A9D4V9G6_ADICA|nr:hypothetical protein GOP47_0001707 [Adiantum capillus-veneris]